MTHAEILIAALILDALLGEPRWIWDRLPHPAVLMGRLIGWADRRFNQEPGRRAKGVALIVALTLGAWGAGSAIAALPDFGTLEILLTAILLAQRSLVTHVRAVAQALRLSLGDGRRSVAMIVGRDTGALDRAGVSRAAIESAAENLSDGVIAPALFGLVFGLPGLLVYKVVNTADSMIGYRTDRHRDFGWAAARFDDLLNLIPARLTAALIALGHGLLHHWPAIARDAALHRSPNAGWPEAAMARALNVALAGPRSYDGQMRDYPFVHPAGNRAAGPEDIDRACRALWRAWALFFALTVGLSILS